MGESLVKMGLIFLLGLPIVLIYAGLPALTWQSLRPFLLVLFLALLLDFCMASSIGLLAFVVEDTFPFSIDLPEVDFHYWWSFNPAGFLTHWSAANRPLAAF